jgi:hypothetical protein
LPWDLIEGKENCTLTMKIGKEHLIPAAREEITSRRALWGTDVYTDDSDVVAACIHAGWIRGAWPDDVDVSMLGLDEGYSVSDVRGLLNGHANGSKGTKQPANHITSALMVLSEPPKTGPMPVPENRDLHVTLLILPRLQKYASTTRFGIKSREFGGPVGDEEAHQRAIHDGISFMVTGLRWVTNGAAAQNRLRGKARRERIRKALAEVEMTPAWIARPAMNGTSTTENGPAIMEKEAGLGWWKQNSSKTPSEGDKENLNRSVPEPRSQEAVEEDGQKEAQEAEVDKDNVPSEVGADTEAHNGGGVQAPEPAPVVKEVDTDGPTPEKEETEKTPSKNDVAEKAVAPKETPAKQDETVENGETGQKESETAEPELEKTTDA